MQKFIGESLIFMFPIMLQIHMKMKFPQIKCVLQYMYRISEILLSSRPPWNRQKLDTAKNKPYYPTSLRVLEIAKKGLSENLTQPSKSHFR